MTLSERDKGKSIDYPDSQWLPESKMAGLLGTQRYPLITAANDQNTIVQIIPSDQRTSDDRFQLQVLDTPRLVRGLQDQGYWRGIDTTSDFTLEKDKDSQIIYTYPTLEQPATKRPDLKDPLTWAKLSQIKSSWFRSIAPQVGLDPNKLVLGSMLSTIVGDDENCFHSYALNKDDPELMQQAQEKLRIRLDWEAKETVMPQRLRKLVRSVKKEVTSGNWIIEEDAKRSYDAWLQLKNQTNLSIDENIENSEAVDYYRSRWEFLSRYWNKFLYGSRT